MNILTEKLLSDGYTADNHPDYVRWYAPTKEFEYTSEFLNKSTWEAPCGVMRKGRFTYGYGSVNGIDWRVENDNYNFGCPYRKKDCEFFHPLLKDFIGAKCSWHMTDKPYDYNNSAEKIEDERRKRIRQNLKEKFGRPGMIHCVCCHIDEDTCEIYFKFDPRRCIDFMRNGCDNGTCYCTGKERNLKKGNIYYDTKVTAEFREGFIIEPRITITKGKKLFDSPKAITDLENYLKFYPDCIFEKERYSREHSLSLFNAEYYGRKYKLEIVNIRIESKPGRDLIQDLQDIRDGIEVIHESDKIKSIKKQKSQARTERREKKIAKIEAKIISLGYDNLEDIDQIRADKWLGKERIIQLEAERKKRLRQAEVKPIQMELSDFLN